MKTVKTVIFVLTLITVISQSFADTVTFQREYTYQASEVDSKISCRTIALEQVKKQLLEELGTYIESRTEIRNMNLTNEQITEITAGIVQTKIIEEDWDGQKYYLKAKIEADPEEVARSIEYLRRDQEKTKQLENTRKKMEAALQEIERLKNELASNRRAGSNLINKQKEYNDSVKKVQETEEIYVDFSSNYYSMLAKQSAEYWQRQEEARRALETEIARRYVEYKRKYLQDIDRYYKQINRVTPRAPYRYIRPTPLTAPRVYRPLPPIQQRFTVGRGQVQRTMGLVRNPLFRRY